MFSYVKTINELLNNSVRDKTQYIPSLKKAEEELQGFFYKVHYQYEPGISLHTKSSEARMQDACARLNQSKEDPRLGIGECVKYCSSVLEEFFKQYYLGFVYRVETNSIGYLEVELHCMLHSGYGDNQEAKAKRFNEQMNLLREMGMTITPHKTMKHRTIDATDNNQSLIKGLLERRGAKGIQFRIKRDAIDQIIFYIHPKNILNFQANHTIIDNLIQATLTNDEMQILRKNAAEIADALACVQDNDDMANTCCFVAESCFVDMCKVINFDCELSRRYTARFAEESSRNAAIRKMDSEVGAAFPAAQFQSTLDNLRHNLNRFCVENLKSFPRDINLDRYGCLSAHASWIPNAEDFIYYLDEELVTGGKYPSNADFEDSFETVSIGEQQYLLDTESNRNMLMKFMERIEGCTISSFNVQVRKEPTHGILHVINQFEIQADYLSNLIRLYDDK